MIIIHDARLPEEYTRALKDKTADSVLYPLRIKNKKITYKSILSHPDIYLFQLNKKTIIHAPCVPDDMLGLLKENGIKLIKGKHNPGERYPFSARYNAVRVGNRLFHNSECIDPVIIELAEEMGLKGISVEQGYSRCSVLAINDRAIVTPDRGIFAAAREEGIEVLLVNNGHIFLPGERYGFLGGAGSNVFNKTVILLGDLRLHPDAVEIGEFFSKYRTKLIDLIDLPLYDAGSLIALEEGL